LTRLSTHDFGDMVKDSIPRDPPATAGKPPARPDRLAREAAALRANLLKRKDQARKRATPSDTPGQDDSSSTR
jgi:hypothetical protein